MYEPATRFQPYDRRRSSVATQAAKLTLGIWAFTFILFLAPQWVAFGHVPSFIAGLLLLLIGIGVVLSAALYWVAARLRSARAWKKTVGVGAAVCIVALGYSLIDAMLGGEIIRMFMSGHHIPPDVLNRTVSNFISFSWLFGLLGTIYVILHASEALREREVQLVEARSVAQAAQLAALRLQLNPHFLFNTLNAISSLIVSGRSKDGEAMLGKLSAFLRSALTPNLSDTVTLGQELETLQSYLEVEAVRFGDRLSVEFHAASDLLEVSVPSFILQPLVENAIKHDVAQTSRPVLIEVSAERTGGDLMLTVRSSGAAPARVEAGTGVGLANTAHRLNVLYGPGTRLEALPIRGGFMTTIRLPLFAAL